MLGLLGKKIGMTTVFNSDGHAVPVTVLMAGPCKILQIKDNDKDGYSALQLGFEPTNKKVTKPYLGHFKKARVQPHKRLAEFRIPEADLANYNLGDTIDLSIFKVGKSMSVTGISKGKGFQGTIKRWGFSGGPKTHGQKDKFRSPGSIGQSSTPSKVIKGMKMSGHMGNARVTEKGLKIVKIDAEKHIMLVKGSVPGANGGYVRLVMEK